MVLQLKMTYYKLPVAAQGYEAGTELREVTIVEARDMECNRCGDCCNGMSEHVKKDPTTGLPLFVWGSKFPEDLYEKRYGKRLLQPIGFLDNSDEMPYQGRIGIVDKFEEDTNDKPHTCFSCSFHRQDTPDFSTCTLVEQFQNPDPSKLEQIRPLNCGQFPVFGHEPADAIISGQEFIPATGNLPRCTWYGLRIVGPYKDTLPWRTRWERQKAGIPVPEIGFPQEFIDGLVYKQGKANG